jgi:hypothetical protein
METSKPKGSVFRNSEAGWHARMSSPQGVKAVLSVFCEPLSPRWCSVFDVSSLAGELTPLLERR